MYKRQGFKIVPYCPRCGTPLSAQEVSQGYKTVKAVSYTHLMPSIFGEDLFDDFMGYPTGRQAAVNAYPQVKDMMKTDIRDVDGNYELEIDLPGFKKEDVKIQLKNGYLNIQATREEKKDEKDDKGKYVRRESYTGTLSLIHI